jgi:hypothetical protein
MAFAVRRGRSTTTLLAGVAIAVIAMSAQRRQLAVSRARTQILKNSIGMARRP